MRAAIASCALLLLAAAQATGATPEPDGCAAAIQAAETAHRLPPGLLGSIALVESGRADPRTGRVSPWPWAINVAGAGHYPPSKADAIAAVEASRASGVQSIDVGCMQINLLHHPAAFASLDHAFDPQVNATYAARFLLRLFAQHGSWPEAAASYHSQTPEHREKYQRRVMAAWPAASRYGFVLQAAAPAKQQVDPYRNYTPELRAQLAENASDRTMRVAMGLVRPAVRTSRAASVSAISPPRSRVRVAELARD